MKGLAIMSSVLILQTFASFFDEFRGAVSSVESSFGKLLSDVIYDVKETIDCTLLAVEQVLSLGMFDDLSEYDRRCKDAPAPVEQPAVVVESALAPPPVQEILTQNPTPVLNNKESWQIDSPILHVDEVLCDVLKKDDPHSQLESVKLALRNETERLTEISDLLKKQLVNLSNEVKEKFTAIELQTAEPSVETIWNDIKILQEIEHRHKNTAETAKISHILDQILNILDANNEDQTTADDSKIKEIMRKLSKHAKDGTSNLWKNADEYPKDFREYANKIFEVSRGSSSLESSSKMSKSENNKKENPKVHDKEEEPQEVTTAKPKQKKRTRTTTTTTERPLTIEELAAQYGSLFDFMPDIDSKANKQAAESAKSIIKETKVSDMVIKSLDDLSANKEARDLFDDPELLDAIN